MSLVQHQTSHQFCPMSNKLSSNIKNTRRMYVQAVHHYIIRHDIISYIGDGSPISLLLSFFSTAVPARSSKHCNTWPTANYDLSYNCCCWRCSSGGKRRNHLCFFFFLGCTCLSLQFGFVVQTKAGANKCTFVERQPFFSCCCRCCRCF